MTGSKLLPQRLGQRLWTLGTSLIRLQVKAPQDGVAMRRLPSFVPRPPL